MASARIRTIMEKNTLFCRGLVKDTNGKASLCGKALVRFMAIIE